MLLIVGGVVAGLYFWNKIRNNKDEILDKKQDIVQTRQENITSRTEIIQENRTERWDDFLDTISNMSGNNKTDGGSLKGNDKKVKSSSPKNSDYNAKTGTLTYSGQGYSVSPDKAGALRYQLNSQNDANAQKLYSKIVVNPYKSATLRG